MYLLKHPIPVARDSKLKHSHSTMYLLKQVHLLTVSMRALHSPMYLLKQTMKLMLQKEHMHSHSTMYLLKRYMQEVQGIR